MSDPGEPAGGARPPVDPNDPVFVFLKAMWEMLNLQQPLEPMELRGEVAAVLAAHPAPPRLPGMTADEQAQALADEAWEAEERGPYMALDALRLDQDCADAYVYLGTISGEDPQLSFALFGLGMLAGSAAIGGDTFEQSVGRFWREAETRPFMRALEGAARATWEMGEIPLAIDYYLEMLRLNPDDDQGARYSLLALALETGHSELAGGIFQNYEEPTAQLAYARALDAFQRLGDCPESQALLAAAVGVNARVVEFLAGTQEPPMEAPTSFAIGSEGEAALCADLYFDAWQRTPGAMEWLAGAPAAPVPPAAPIVTAAAPAKTKREGPRAID
jgi:tetratricopeptide (TPR) repeat protein